MSWPSARIPYVISRYYDDHTRAIIAKAIEEYHNKTCVRFVPKEETDLDYIYFFAALGCASQIGRTGGMQVISISKGLNLRYFYFVLKLE